MSSVCNQCEDNLCCINLGQRYCPQHCTPEWDCCVGSQPEQIRNTNPWVDSKSWTFRSECYIFTYVWRVINRSTFISQGYCVEHNPKPNCPHQEETHIDALTLIQTTGTYHCNLKMTSHTCRRSVCTERIEDRETMAAGSESNSRMVPGILKRIDAAQREYLLLNEQVESEDAEVGRREIEIIELSSDLVQSQLLLLIQQFMHVRQEGSEEKHVSEDEFDSVKNNIVILKTRPNTKNRKSILNYQVSVLKWYYIG